MSERERWNEKYIAGNGPNKQNPRLKKYRGLIKPGRALDIAGGIGQNAELLKGWTVVNVDLADAALKRGCGLRVLADAAALPFGPESFDAIICTNFFEPKIDYAALLTPGGTLFFETFTLSDQKYRPDFNPAFLLDPMQTPVLFRDLDTLVSEETDNGKRIFLTFVGKKKS